MDYKDKLPFLRYEHVDAASSSKQHSIDDQHDKDVEVEVKLFENNHKSTIIEFHDVELEHMSHSIFDTDRIYCAKLMDKDDSSLIDDMMKNEKVPWRRHLEKMFQTDIKAGLPLDETYDNFKQRKQVFGSNIRAPGMSSDTDGTWYTKALAVLWSITEGFRHHSLILLLFLEIVVLIVDGSTQWAHSLKVIGAVCLVIIVNSLNKYYMEVQLKRLSSINNADISMVRVMRAGVQKQVNTRELNVGEVIMIEPGCILPVDGILLDSFNLACQVGDGYSSDCVQPRDGSRLYSGTKVVQGYGSLLVVCIGDYRHSWTSSPSPSPLQDAAEQVQVPNYTTQSSMYNKLTNLANNIAKVSVVVAMCTFFIIVIKHIIVSVAHDGNYGGTNFIVAVVNYFILAATIICVIVPDGLPQCISFALAYNTGRIIKDNIMVRNLHAFEQMGTVTTICTDISGLMTVDDKINVVTASVMGVKVNEELGPLDHASITQQLSSAQHDLLFEAIAVNSLAFEQYDPYLEESWLIGNQVECALLSFASKMGLDIVGTRARCPSTARGDQWAVYKLADGYRYVIRGSSEDLIAKSTHMIGNMKVVVDISQEKRTKMMDRVKLMSSQCLRTISVAYMDIVDERDWTTYQPDQLVLICVFGIKDPLRRQIPSTIKRCQDAGIITRLITHENIDHAKAIAEVCGLLSNDDICMEASELNTKSKLEVEQMLPKIKVLAKASSQDKLDLITMLQAHGEVVGVTGDNTHDVPSFDQSDVSYSKGKNGTDIAREESDIILIDDSFSSIVNSIVWGRNIMDSIQKMLQFQLTVYGAAVIITIIGVITSSSSPLTLVQLLWINLIMETIGSFSLATESPRNELLNSATQGKSIKLINKGMWFNIIGQSMVQTIILIILLFTGGQDIIFNTFVFLQLFNQFNSRRIQSSTKNVFGDILNHWQFMMVMAMTIFIQIVAAQIGGLVFGSVPLSIRQWFASVGLGAISLPVGQLLKYADEYDSGQFMVIIKSFIKSVVAATTRKEYDILGEVSDDVSQNKIDIDSNSDVDDVGPAMVQPGTAKGRWIKAIKQVRAQVHCVGVWRRVTADTIKRKTENVVLDHHVDDAEREKELDELEAKEESSSETQDHMEEAEEDMLIKVPIIHEDQMVMAGTSME
ncbi:hypothetical protein SAMD00019534_051790 [Acytostelium subglobosum LB1]|uniref:hypothetical protein n=1 Tax=Acytostelium subglobosum LB1 TaxID=1410327 RepID=UPI000644F60B|nr:hypothetical protein SAMD00019534_051790 [Acytostelium subglobosum LB1]GAM22004.1 hypothetical protein SAMD00019534_051790 [Acytostelium subglobosum LB1]|eukprot:XP_012755104.1 hypothetical protein SAMD00019534_051790 [Acytostelium subglobosum LB1]